MNERAAILLHVDDGADERELVARVHRRRAPASILVQVPTTAEARSLVESGSLGDAALVLVDLRMPGEGGEAFVTWLRERPDLGSVPIYILSGHPGAEAAAQRCGADGAIEKVVDYDLMVESLADVFRRHLPSLSGAST